jgi:putative glutamine amidotransferase
VLSPIFAFQETMSSSNQTKPIIACTVYHHEKNTPLPKMALTAAYLEAVERAGGIPIMVPLGLDSADVAAVLERADGVLLPGGGDIHPDFYREAMNGQILEVDAERDRIEIEAARIALVREMPLLGICRGHQILNVALGGTLWADVPSQMPGSLAHDFAQTHPRSYEAHAVDIAPDSRLAQILGRRETAVNSLHHQGVKELAPGLRVSATAPDGLIEGVELPDHPFALGVQWHPEWLIPASAPMMQLFIQFVQAAQNGRA